MNLKLIEANENLKHSYLDYVREWIENHEKIIPASSDIKSYTYEYMLDKWRLDKNDEVVKKRLVPSNTYFLVDEHNKIYGSLNFRHYLNDHLLLLGGHIGYGIRPSEREQGYASYMLKLGLDKIIKNHNLDKVLITCNKNNIASAKTIIKNGGVLENEVNKGESIIQRYWIHLR